MVVIADGMRTPQPGCRHPNAEAAGATASSFPNARAQGYDRRHAASAGAAGHLAVARVANIAATVSFLKEQGVWIYAADMDGKDWCAVDYTGPWHWCSDPRVRVYQACQGALRFHRRHSMNKRAVPSMFRLLQASYCLKSPVNGCVCPKTLWGGGRKNAFKIQR